MIYGILSDIGAYKGRSANLDTAIEYIKSCDLRSLIDGRNEIDGDNVYLNCFGYKTMKEDECFFEAHRRYLDVHIVLTGNELIGVSDTASLEKTDENDETDYVGYKGKVKCYYKMNTSKFLIAYPEDAHMVKLMDREQSYVKKAVIKVLI